jgi:hypothetical protein
MRIRFFANERLRDRPLSKDAEGGLVVLLEC